MDTNGQRLLFRDVLVATQHQAAMIEQSSFMAEAVQNRCRQTSAHHPKVDVRRGDRVMPAS
ncbi:hypothetical protein CD943_04405 [Brevundimonas diminuta]|uniref:Uncharacterized protein n=1 Tax=Brevundimonas diminuta TaxID=293 RepID=A0A1Z3LVF1_BREDI|nr:hypothetical protein CD943_04405 [Brevundimonas diminuta]